MTDLHDAAKEYARRRWPVLPLHSWTGDGCTCGDAGCKSPAKHPRNTNGLDGATTDADVIARWWKHWPSANVGLRTGLAFDVVDIDGQVGLDALNTARADRPITWGPEARTGSGGWHLLHLPTGGGNRVRLLDHVDFRGKGGYIVAPPSLHAVGRTYEWAEMAGPDEPLEPLPDWLRALVLPPPPPQVLSTDVRSVSSNYGRQALDAELGRVAMAVEGDRNHQLNRSAFALGQLVASGVLSADVVVSSLVAAAARAGLTGTEVEKTIASGIRKGLGQPRRVSS